MSSLLNILVQGPASTKYSLDLGSEARKRLLLYQMFWLCASFCMQKDVIQP
jgi:hypothetical protein